VDGAGEQAPEAVVALAGQDFKRVAPEAVLAVAVEARGAVLEIEADGATQEVASEIVVGGVRGVALVVDVEQAVVASEDSRHEVSLCLWDCFQ
jgi:hypothetical protein